MNLEKLIQNNAMKKIHQVRLGAKSGVISTFVFNHNFEDLEIIAESKTHQDTLIGGKWLSFDRVLRSALKRKRQNIGYLKIDGRCFASSMPQSDFSYFVYAFNPSFDLKTFLAKSAKCHEQDYFAYAEDGENYQFFCTKSFEYEGQRYTEGQMIGEVRSRVFSRQELSFDLKEYQKIRGKFFEKYEPMGVQDCTFQALKTLCEESRIFSPFSIMPGITPFRSTKNELDFVNLSPQVVIVNEKHKKIVRVRGNIEILDSKAMKDIDGIDISGVMSYDYYAPYAIKEVKFYQGNQEHYAYLIAYDPEKEAECVLYHLVLLVEFCGALRRKMRFGSLATIWLSKQDGSEVRASGEYLTLLREELKDYHSKLCCARIENLKSKGDKNE